MRKRLLIGFIAIAVLGFGFSGSALAASPATGSITVNASVDVACSIGTPTPLAFPAYGGVPVDGTGTISVTCSNGAPYTIELDGGNNGTTQMIDPPPFEDDDGNIVDPDPYPVYTRRATDGASFLNYDIYQNAGHTQVWDDGINVKNALGTGGAQSHTLYGRVPAQSPVPPNGTYSDVVDVTVNY